MREEISYLSDEELEQLILQVEEHELVAAPPELTEKIFACTDIVEIQSSLKDKKKEFYRYCFQVITSAAAAIAIIFGLPHVEVKPKVELLSRQEVLKASITREEVLQEKKIFFKIFHEEEDFDDRDESLSVH